MASHTLFFLSGFAFLIGIAAASLSVPPFFISCISLLASGICIYLGTHNKKYFGAALIMVCILFGAWYARVYDERFHSIPVPFDTKIRFQGVVAGDPIRKENSLEFPIRFYSPFKGKVLARTRVADQYAYGDVVYGEGKIEVSENVSYMNTLEKDKIFGILPFPNMKKTGQWDGSKIRAFLISLKHSVMNLFKRILPSDEATFLAGLTIGARGSFPESLTNALRESGTMHLVALSGYNIMILVSICMMFFVYIMRRRAAVYFTIGTIVFFVVFAGAESSLVRAAILGFLSLLAGEVGRRFDIRQALIAAAVCMTAINPKILLFDIGFQLSFLAFLGIAYIAPVLKHRFGVEEGKKWFAFKSLALDTCAAQLATIPVLVAQFGTISIIGILSNVIILEFIPLTMGLGFLTMLFGYIWFPLAFGVGMLAHIFLFMELFIIKFFGSLHFGIPARIGPFIAGIYYLLLGLFVWARRKIFIS